MSLRGLTAVGNAMYKGCLFIGASLAVAMTFIVIANIVARYFFNYALSWAEEVARYMMVWSALLGAAMGVRNGAHFRMEMIEHAVKPGGRAVLSWITRAVLGGMGVLLLWQGFILVRLTNYQHATATQMPMSWVYVSLPLGGLLMLFFVVEQSLKALVGAGLADEMPTEQERKG